MRMCILQICVRRNEIEEYIFYLINKLNEISDDLLVVANGKCSDSDKTKIKDLECDLFERQDQGFDSGAFRDAMLNHITWDKLTGYDEVVLVNDSCYGPMFSLQKMFEYMDKEKSDLDYWTITEQESFKKKNWGKIIPYHVQPYFLVIRRKLLCSQIFFDFWNELEVPSNYAQAISNYELKFAEFFAAKDFKGGAYIDGKKLCSEGDDESAYVFFDTYKLLNQYKCPMIKRKAFRSDWKTVLGTSAGENAKRTIDYIKKETNYDSELIIQDMIHNMPLDDIYLTLHLNHIVKQRKQNNNNNKYGIAIFVDNMIPKETLQKIIQEIPENLELILVNVSRDSVGGELESIMKYEYVVFFDLRNWHFHNKVVETSYFNLVQSNMFASVEYINGIVDIFAKDKRLGALYQPSTLFSNLLINEFEKKTVRAIWVKREIIERLLIKGKEQKLEDNLFSPQLNEVLKLNGKYYGRVLSDEYASLFISNYEYMLQGLILHSLEDKDILPTYRDIVMVNPKMASFCERFERIYIFGAGEYGHHCRQYLEDCGVEFAGYIVSDDHKKNIQEIEKVYMLSEVYLQDGEGIIVAVDSHNYESVKDKIYQLDTVEKNNIIYYLA